MVQLLYNESPLTPREMPALRIKLDTSVIKHHSLAAYKVLVGRLHRILYLDIHIGYIKSKLKLVSKFL